MSDKDKIEVINKCLDRTYEDQELSPILNDIYDLADFEKQYYFLDCDGNKISFYDKMFPFFKYIVKGGDIPLFHDIAYILSHPKNSAVSAYVVIDLYKLAIEPYEYCRSDNVETLFTMIADFLVEEKDYDFCLKHSNYLYYYCMGRLIESRTHDRVSWKFTQYVIHYLFENKIDEEKAKKCYDFFIENGSTFSSYFVFNYNKNNGKEFLDMITNKIFNEMELNKKEIK